MKQDHLIEHFVAGTAARCTEALVSVNHKTAAYNFHRPRAVIVYHLEPDGEMVVGGEIEVDKSCFGGFRKGMRGRGATGKAPVLGLLKRGGRVYTKIISDVHITMLFLALALAQPVAAQSFKPDNNAGVAAFKRGDYARALQPFRPLADHGHAGAQYNLGVAFDGGLGVTKDPKQEVLWYRKASNQGYAHAQANLGATYFTGNGVLKDLTMAYAWFNPAAANGKSKLAPKSRKFIGQRLSQSDLKKAQKLSKLCLKKPAMCPQILVRLSQ